MGPLNRGLLYTVCCGLVALVTCNALAQDQPAKSIPVVSSSSATSENKTTPAGSSGLQELPDSPGTEWARLQEPASQQDGSAQTSSQQSTNTQDKPQRPAGTAAAEAPKVTGITAAEPAGVAIAPAKQRRVRTIVLKVGAIIGAGAAVGTVIALTAGTSSKPPGAH